MSQKLFPKSFTCSFYQCYKISTEKTDLVHSTDFVIFKWINDDKMLPTSQQMWLFILFVVMTIILSEFLGSLVQIHLKYSYWWILHNTVCRYWETQNINTINAISMWKISSLELQ